MRRRKASPKPATTSNFPQKTEIFSSQMDSHRNMHFLRQNSFDHLQESISNWIWAYFTRTVNSNLFLEPQHCEISSFLILYYIKLNSWWIFHQDLLSPPCKSSHITSDGREWRIINDSLLQRVKDSAQKNGFGADQNFLCTTSRKATNEKTHTPAQDITVLWRDLV